MDSPLTASTAALHLFFTDDVYLVNEPGLQVSANSMALTEPAVNTAVNPVADPVAAIPPISQESPEKIAETAALPAQEPVAFKFLGKNQRNILILVNDGQNDVSNEAGRELLRKIVKSVNLTANDFALLNYASCGGASFKQLTDYFSSTLVFVFGVTPEQLSLGVHPEHAIVNEGSVKLIFAAELSVLDQNPAGKKALWGSLQNLGL